MSKYGLIESEGKVKSLRRVLEKNFNQQMSELKSELKKLEFVLADKEQLRAWRNSSADMARLQPIYDMLDETEKLYMVAGDTEAGRIFKSRMKKALEQRVTNLKANEIDVKVRMSKLKLETEQQALQTLNDIYREGTARELFTQAKASGGFLSNVGRSYMKDIVTLETKSAGSKTIGEYMKNLFNQYEEGLKDVFVKGIVRGDSYQKMEENLIRATNITKGKANLLVRTEANAIFNQSVRNVIEDNPLVAGYRFRATLDSRTSSICQQMDGKYIPKEEVKPGVNYPPLHPNCRSTVTTVLVKDKDKQDLVQRYTKNGANQWEKVPPGMNYLEYKHKFGFSNSKNPRTFNARTRSIHDNTLAKIDRPKYQGYVKPSASSTKRIQDMVNDYINSDGKDTPLLKAVKENTGFTTTRKAMLRQAQAESGFDGLPLRLDPREFERQASKEGHIKLYRSVSSEEFAEQFKSGPHMYGNKESNYGAGTYAYTEPPVDQRHGKVLIEMAMKYDEEKVLDLTELGFESQVAIGSATTPDTRINEVLSKVPPVGNEQGKDRRDLISLLATQYGYDAIRVNTMSGGRAQQYMVILNRTSVLVKE